MILRAVLAALGDASSPDVCEKDWQPCAGDMWRSPEWRPGGQKMGNASSRGVPTAHSFVLGPAASSPLFAPPLLPFSGPQARVPVRVHLTAWHKSESENRSVVSDSL